MEEGQPMMAGVLCNTMTPVCVLRPPDGAGRSCCPLCCSCSVSELEALLLGQVGGKEGGQEGRRPC